MWLVMTMAVAWGARPLDVQVVREPVDARPDRVPMAGRPAVPVGHGVVVVDGERDLAWDAVKPSPPLVPVVDGGPAHPARLKVMLDEADHSVVLLLPRLNDAVQTVVLDPQGTRAGWWTVSVGQDITARWCSLTAVTLPEPAVVPSRAVPCEVVSVSSAVGDVVEVALPAPTLTDRARLLYVVDGPGSHDGTWAPSGHAVPWPEHGRWLAVPRPLLGVDREVGDLGVWMVSTELPDDVPCGALTGTLVAPGVRRALDAPTCDGSTARWTVKRDGWVEATAVLNAGGSGWPVASTNVKLWTLDRAAWMATPVFVDHVIVGVVVPRAEDVQVRVRGPKGFVLGVAQIALPAGRSRLVIPIQTRARSVRIDVSPQLGWTMDAARVAP